MKKLLGNALAKSFLILLSFFCVIVLILSAAATFLMGYYKFYFSNEETVKNEILTDMLTNEAYHTESLIMSGIDLNSYYSDKNIYYTLINNLDNQIVESNYNGEDYLISHEYDASLYHYFSLEDEDRIKDKYESYTVLNESIEARERLKIKLYVAKDLSKNDIFSVTLKIVELGFKLEYTVIIIMIASLLLFITSLCFLYTAAGRSEEGEIKENYIDKIPFDIYTFFVFIAAVISIYMLDFADTRGFFLIFVAVVGSIDYFIALGYTMSLATRIKTQTLLKNTIIYRVLKFIGKDIKKLFKWLSFVFSNTSLIKKTVLIILSLLALELLALTILFNYAYLAEFWIILLLILNVAFISLMLYFGIILSKIKSGGEKIAKGELEHKINTEFMFGDFKEFSNSLNNINEGLQSAVNERIKSERFKTELITNVSHDIKTPLTSIINYVDLIKKEECENPNIGEYIEVLDRQSIRLKKLVEDLVEASKASSGVLSVNMVPCDVGVLLYQTLGEFEEKLAAKNITPIIGLPEENVEILADSRHLWRIFDNLMNNICKYALEGTRAYIDVKKVGNNAVVIFRNISKYQLSISSEELTERFVRGDKSRNSEGSGLGLSIARSLAELQGASLDINVDGDLFKAMLIFRLFKTEENKDERELRQ